MKSGSGYAAGKSAADVANLARLARETALRQDGVAKMSIRLSERLCACRTPGVVARLGRDGWLRMDIRVVARDGVDMLQLGSDRKSVV